VELHLRSNERCLDDYNGDDNAVYMADGGYSYEHNIELGGYCDVLEENPDIDSWVPLLFELVEEFDADVDLTLTSPGPIVHVLETTAPKYQEYLIASMARKPTCVAVWMADRISRTPGEDKAFWVKKSKRY